MNFDEIKNKLVELLSTSKHCVFSTSNAKGEIDSASMCLINDGLTIYLQTDSSFEKVKNIKENPNVAINIGAYSFKGKATIVGKPSDNEFFISQMKVKQKTAYKLYTNLPSEVLIEVKLSKAKIWQSKEDLNKNLVESIISIDFSKKTITETICDRL